MIGIITFHSQYNCGSALQAFALQEEIKLLGYDCKILNYYYKDDMKNYDIRFFSKNLKVILFDLYTLKNCIQRKKSYMKFQKNYFVLSDITFDWRDLKKISADCDILLCGSDQIWNVRLTRGLHPAYFLKFSETFQKLISYAPSIALDHIPDNYKIELKNTLERFQAISVREEQTAYELSLLTHKTIFCALDPTLLHDATFYEKILHNYDISIPYRYVFIYCLHYENLNRLKHIAENIANEQNIFIVYFNKFKIHNKLYKLNIFKYGPEAFLYAIKNSNFVIADSYHAAIFSIIYKKQFWIYAVDGSRSRMDTLFNRLGLEKNYINDGEKYTFIDYKKITPLLIEQRNESIEYLKASLEEVRDDKL